MRWLGYLIFVFGMWLTLDGFNVMPPPNSGRFWMVLVGLAIVMAVARACFELLLKAAQGAQDSDRKGQGKA